MIIVPSVDKYGGQDTDGQFVLFTKARQYFWDSNALQWVRATASSGGVPSNDVTDRPGRLLGHVSIDAGGTMVGSALASASLPVVIASDQTVPISAASLPLPAGASTSAKQPALGTAGTASADVITVQGIASMTALKVDGSGVTQPVSGTVTANIGTSGSLALDASVTGLQVAQESTTAAQKGTLAMGAVTTAAPSYTTAKTDMLSLTPAGGLRVDGSAVTQPISAASLPLPAGASTSAKQPALGTAGTASADVITVQGIASMTALKVDGSVTGTYGAPTNVAASVTTGTLQASNVSRRGLIVSNDSTSKLYVLFGAGTVSSTNYTYVIPPGGTLEEMTPLSTAICTGVWQSANGTAGVTEIT